MITFLQLQKRREPWLEPRPRQIPLWLMALVLSLLLLFQLGLVVWTGLAE